MDNSLVGVSFAESINMEDKINQIHELIKGICPEAVSVKVLVNCQGIEFTPNYRTNIKDFSMQTICGEWVKKSE